MSARSIYVDVDDVLSETTRALIDLAHRLFGRRVEFDAVHSFDLGVSFGLSREEWSRLMHEAHRPERIESLPPLDGAARTLRAWRERGHRVAIVTGRPASSNPASLRWLERHDMPFHRFDSLDKYDRHSGDDARHTLTLPELERMAFDLAIEDMPEMALRLARTSARTVLLLDRPWNRSFQPPERGFSGRIVRVRAWSEIAPFVDELGGTV